MDSTLDCGRPLELSNLENKVEKGPLTEVVMWLKAGTERQIVTQGPENLFFSQSTSYYE